MPFLPTFVLLLLTRAHIALSHNNSNSTHQHPGISYITTFTYSHTPANTRTRSTHTPPGPDIDPPGVTIYDSLQHVPTAKLLSRAHAHAKCYRRQGDVWRRASCFRAYVCGYRCEQVLLAVRSYCKDMCETERECGWVRCQKARKFKRCFARVCFRRRDGGKVGLPVSFEDSLSVAIVRYRRPLPRHELLARRRKMSSTQSAIFK